MKTNTTRLLWCAMTFCAVTAGPLGAQTAAREGAPRETKKNGNATAQLADRDEKFIKDAAQGGMSEVRLGELARDKASRPEVKDFGRMMVNDHSKANADLKAIAGRKGIQLAEQLDATHARKVEDLNKLSGSDFDKAYMAEMVRDHKKDVSEFEDASRGAKDPDLKAFAERTLPTLRNHLERAQAIQSAVK